MKGKRHTEEQIIKILKEIEAGKSVAKTCRKPNVSGNTVYRPPRSPHDKLPAMIGQRIGG